MNSGIYCIKNDINDRIYIGSSKNLADRRVTHFNRLRSGKHTNLHLQHAFNKYGEEHFTFAVIEYVSPERRVEIEQWWIDHLGIDNLYNIRPIAESNMGLKHTDETKQKIGQGNLGKKVSEQSKEKLRQAHLGKKHTEEHIEKVRQTKLGHKTSDETREKLRQVNLGKKMSVASIEKMRWAKLGKQQSDEHIEKRVAANQKRVAQIDRITGETIEIWDGIKNAGESLGIHHQSISAVCRGKYKSAGGYRWEYI